MLVILNLPQTFHSRTKARQKEFHLQNWQSGSLKSIRLNLQISIFRKKRTSTFRIWQICWNHRSRSQRQAPRIRFCLTRKVGSKRKEVKRPLELRLDTTDQKSFRKHKSFLLWRRMEQKLIPKKGEKWKLFSNLNSHFTIQCLSTKYTRRSKETNLNYTMPKLNKSLSTKKSLSKLNFKDSLSRSERNN